MRILVLCLLGGGFGLLASAGVFNIFVAIGLVPRFAGKTHTADKILLYEEMVVFGTLFGGFISLYPQFCQIGGWCPRSLAGLFQVVFGLFSGMFVGCLALAIAEMLDSFPILARRASFRHGLGFAILSMACGKIVGSLWYFVGNLKSTLE